MSAGNCGGHCRKCKYSEGQAVTRAGRWRLVLWCALTLTRAKRVCASYSPMDGET